MKKIFTSFMLLLLMGVSAWAQTATINVQGAPRKVAKAVAEKVMHRAVLTTTTAIDFDKIERWAGKGDCRAALAIKWDNGMNDNKTLVWGYRWNSGEQKTGEDMLDAIAKADPQFYMIKQTGTDYGSAIGGFGYDTDNSGDIIVVDADGNMQMPRNGLIKCGDGYGFDDYLSYDDNDAWNAGWYSGYWSYWVASATTGQLGYSGTGATGRVLSDGCVDAWVWSSLTGSSTNDYDGNFDYLPATTDLTDGTYVVNEDWYGHRNSSVNFLTSDGKWLYDKISEIGATACYGTFFGNRFYVMAKQSKDGGAKVEGGRISVYDANAMKMMKQIPVIDAANGGDGRSFCGVDEHKAYVSTSKGIYILDLDQIEVTGAIKDAEGNDYNGANKNAVQCGNMVRLNDYVYAIAQGKGILVIDANTDQIVSTIACADCGSIVMAKDGSLWVSTKSGISKVNTDDNTLESTVLSDGVKAPSQSWDAWTPDGLCASLQQNVLYWTARNGSTSWSPTPYVYKYDITTGETSRIIDMTSDSEGRTIYGCSFRVDPKTDNLFLTAAVGYNPNYVVRKFDNNGNLLDSYPMDDNCNPESEKYNTTRNYWFPGMFVFTDTEDPVVGYKHDITVEEGKTLTYDLSYVCTDADNFQGAIVKTVDRVVDEKIATATVTNGKLVLTGVKAGSTKVIVKFCSNGISTTGDFYVTVSAATAINAANAANAAHEVARYTIDGKLIQQPQQGVNIVKYSDGSVKKVIVK